MVTHGQFRLGVGMVICNKQGQVLWAKRREKEVWQFPQGGIGENETPEKALYRELEEETGLIKKDIQVLGSTQGWLTYLWPESTHSQNIYPGNIGQRQKWFLIRLLSEDHAIRLDGMNPPEFDQWCWVDYWYPLNHIADFKKQVYHQALHELVIYQ